MSTSQADDFKVERPATWKYLVGALITFPVLFLLWILFDFWALSPELTDIDMGTTMDKLRWIGIPIFLTIILFGCKWLMESNAANIREREWLVKTQQLAEKDAHEKSSQFTREYVLEVLGLGITVEKYRQGKLWHALQEGGAYSSIREADPKKYPWSGLDKIGQTGGRACDALENGADPSPMFWGVPSMYAGGPINNPVEQPSAVRPMPGLASSADGTGMAWHLFVTGPWQLGERPDQLLEQAFAFFDAHPDLPYLVLLANDDEADRDNMQPPGSPPPCP